MTLEIVETILTKNPCYKAGKKIEVQGLMLHSICSPQPSAKVLIHNWNRSGCENKCAHAFIDANTGVVYQTLPFNHRGRHCGRNAETGKTGNDTYLGIEMCEPPQVKYNRDGTLNIGDWVKNPKVIECVERTYKSAVELFAHLCTELRIDPKTGIVSHREAYEKGFANNKKDPEHLWAVLGLPYTMDGFRSDVVAKMSNEISLAVEDKISIKNEDMIDKQIAVEESKTKDIRSTEEKTVLIQVQIEVENLRVRSGPGTEYEPTGKYTGAGVFTIEEIQNGTGSKTGWGRLKSGIGWICLDYTKPMIGVT